MLPHEHSQTAKQLLIVQTEVLNCPRTSSVFMKYRAANIAVLYDEELATTGKKLARTQRA